MTKFLLITHDFDWTERIRAALPQLEADDFQTTDRTAGATFADTMAVVDETDPAVVIIGPDINSGTALGLARALDERRPITSVVLIADPKATLLERAVRAGVRDVIDPRADAQDVRVSLTDTLERATRRRGTLRAHSAAAAPARNVIAVVSPKGGAGKTVVTSNLAVGIARNAPGEVVVVDLDLQFGDVANALRLKPEVSIGDVARAATLDATTVKALLTPHPSGVFVLCAPETPAEADCIKPSAIATTIDLLAEMFRYVIIDTAAGLDEATLVAIEHATDLVVMCATDVASARGLRKELRAFNLLGLTNQRRHFVLNRADARVGVTAHDIESTVGLSVDVSIPSSRVVPASMNDGSPVLESAPRTPLASAFAELVKRFAPPLAVSRAAAPGGGIFRRHRQPR
jgi:pilus assembly protein CpaE